jgi:hypothetical protein
MESDRMVAVLTAEMHAEYIATFTLANWGGLAAPDGRPAA